ncbi:MAG: efflux RND transporter periplasmic adaptor subunit [Nitrosomonadales bacterium]|nr:efflux RND transporter periplasmic adaptor subunit [Nitrosomonadales bacterium]
MTKLRLKLILLATLLISIFAWVVLTQGPLAPVKVATEKIQTGSLASEVFGVGITEARHIYNVSSTMTGRVGSMLVDQGDYVKAGQLLARLDPIDLNERLASSRLMTERSANSIRMAEAQLAQAQSQEKTVSATYKRFIDLHAKGYVSQEMLDAKLNEKNAAQAALDAATASLAAVIRDKEKAQTDASGVAKLRDQTLLISPVSGIVTARMVEQGVTVVPGQTVLQVIDPADVWIKTRIDQKQAGMIRAGQQASIVLRSQQQTAVTGVVKRVDMISDAITEERIVNVSLAVPQSNISLGEYAEVTIKLPGLDNAHSIPTAAVKQIDQQKGAWVLLNGHAKFKAVKTGIATLDGRTQVLDGLSDGDEVIVYSQKAMKEGLKIKVVPEIVKS